MPRSPTSFRDAQKAALRRMKAASAHYNPAAAVSDVYAPEWDAAPAGTVCHSVSADSTGVFWTRVPTLKTVNTTEGALDIWVVYVPAAEVSDAPTKYAYPWDGANPDHRNSLRFLPKRKDTTTDA
jgi:hypothetical protein